MEILFDLAAADVARRLSGLVDNGAISVDAEVVESHPFEIAADGDGAAMEFTITNLETEESVGVFMDAKKDHTEQIMADPDSILTGAGLGIGMAIKAKDALEMDEDGKLNTDNPEAMHAEASRIIDGLKSVLGEENANAIIWTFDSEIMELLLMVRDE